MQTRRNTSSTTTVTDTTEKKDHLVLKLKEARKPEIKWTEDTVDNENMGKKSSKRCCIYHKSKKFGESDSDESDSDTEVAKKQTRKGPPNFQRHHA